MYTQEHTHIHTQWDVLRMQMSYVAHMNETYRRYESFVSHV